MNLFGSKPNIKQVAWYVNASYYTLAHMHRVSGWYGLDSNSIG